MVTKHEQIKRICNFNFKSNFKESLIEFIQSSHQKLLILLQSRTNTNNFKYTLKYQNY